jgi:transposase-like protein
MARKTYDMLAAQALLQKNPAALKKLQAHADARVPCPDCGHEGPHETNDLRRFVFREFLCTSCGSCFEAPDPEDYLR